MIMRHRATLAAWLVLGAELRVYGRELPIPTRQLEWKDVNFLSTSDTHGHQHATWPEPNYSGDFGDFASFSLHLREMARAQGQDLLLIDAGDHHDGSGLVSSSSSSAMKTDEIFYALPYDVLTIGNHELYAYESAKWIYDNQARWHGRYLTSNINITVTNEQGDVVDVPIGERYAKFTTQTGRSVTAFGVIFEFTAHDKNLTVQAPASMAREPWFLDAIAEAPDYFVLAGHMPVRGATAEWMPVFEAIREVHPLVPVFIFGGHTHLRDCMQYDDRSIGVVPGRYMETIAFTSSSLPEKGDARPMNATRRYIDGNRVSYQYHSNTTNESFDTPLGLNITTSLLHLASDLNVSTPLGVSPHDFFLERYPMGHPKHVNTVFFEQVLPSVMYDKHRRDRKRLIIGNTGTSRFDLFQGRFDRNDELTVSPFVTEFLYFTLPASLVVNVTRQMNLAGASKLLPTQPSLAYEEDRRVDEVYRDNLFSQWTEHQESSKDGSGSQVAWDAESFKGATLGYVTRDSCPGRGDDIEHVPVPISKLQPDFWQSPMPDVDHEDDLIDVVVFDFSMDDFLAAIHVLDPSSNLTQRDARPYAEGLKVNAVWGMYASKAWQV